MIPDFDNNDNSVCRIRQVANPPKKIITKKKTKQNKTKQKKMRQS